MPTMNDQSRHLPSNFSPGVSNDREQELQRLAAENAQWAEAGLRLVNAIRENQRRLEQLSAIIHRLNRQREHAEAEMRRTGREHDALADEDAEFRARTDDQADDYADFLLTTQPPRPNPFGLFKEPG